MYELWFRETYKTLIQIRRVRLALRPGDRRYPQPKGVKEGDLAKIKILKRPGIEEQNIPPLFDDFETIVRIRKIAVKKLGELNNEELKTCSPDCQTKEVAKYHLGLIYNREFNDDDLISVIHFDYID